VLGSAGVHFGGLRRRLRAGHAQRCLVNLHSAVGVGHALGNLFTAWRNRHPWLSWRQQARAILPFEPFLYANQAAEFPRPYVMSCEPAGPRMCLQPSRGPTTLQCNRRAARPSSRYPWMTGIGRASPSLHAPSAGLSWRSRAAGSCRAGPASSAAAGHRCRRIGRSRRAWEEALELAERNQAPVWVSPMSGRNSFPESHPLFAGFLPADRGKIVARLQGSDLVLVLGAPAFTYHMEGFGPHIPPGAESSNSRRPLHCRLDAGRDSIVTSLRHGIRALSCRTVTRQTAHPVRLSVRPARWVAPD